MQKGRNGRVSDGQRVFLPLLFGILAFLALAGRSGAALLGMNYEITWDQDVDKTETETTDVRKFKHTLEVKYKGFVSPIVENEASLKIEQEIVSNAPDITRFLPTLDLGFKGRFWEATGGVKRTQENSDDPAENPKVTTNYFVEIFYTPPTNIPDLKTKYTLDEDFEEGVTDTEKQEVTFSSVYQPTDWLHLKGDFTRTTDDDKLNPDSDTEDEKFSGTAGIRHFLSEKVKVDAEYNVEITRGATLLDAGGETDREEEHTHRVKNALSFRPFRDTNLDGSYDYELKQDRVTGEHTHTQDLKATAAQKIGKPFDLKGEFTRNVVEEKHTADDNEKTEDRYTAELKAKFARQLDFSFKYEKTDTDEIHADPANNTTSGSIIKTATWTGELAPFWKASATVEKTDTLEDEARTTVDRKYSLKSTFDFKAIDLTLDPTYEITRTEDLLIPEETETRDFRFKIAYKVFSTRTMEAKFDHTFGRKVDTGAGNIQRTDDTTVNLTWTDPMPGWSFGVDVTRSATDTSEDDLAPDITATYGFKADYKRDQLSFGTAYKFDRRSLTDDSETFDVKVGWVARWWETTLTYSFDKTFSEALDEGYTINLTFKVAI